MTDKNIVLIADGLASDGKEKLAQIDSVQLWDLKGIEREELKQKLSEAHLLIVRSRTQVDSELLEHAKKLKLVIRAGIGLDNIDIAACTDKGIVVMNAPTGNMVTTAEHTIAMMFAVTRHIPSADASLRSGKWDKKKFQGNELNGKTLGIVGLGNIGKIVANRALGLGMRILGSDPFLSKEVAAAKKIGLVELDELLANSDYVTVHVPLSEGTRYLIGEQAIEKMKKGAYLINCARGGVVKETALLKALESGKLAGCALDVFEKEPLAADHPFLQRTDVVMTPHLGASTDEAQTQVSLEVAEQVSQYLNDGVLRNAINVPNLSVEELTVLKPYVNLCERIASFSSQIAPKNVQKIRVRFAGEITEKPLEVLTLAVLKGFLSPFLYSAVNFVNARKLMKERGIRVEESREQHCPDYSNLIEVEVVGDETLTCSGTLFGRNESRIVRIDHFAVDAVPEGVLLYTKNDDQPGVIGTMGTLLGKTGINIARMALGFDKQKGQAIALINVDSKLNEETLEALRKANGMIAVQQVEL